MTKEEWEARSKRIDEKISKIIKPLADSIVLEFDLNDRSAYGAIANVAHGFEYPKVSFAETDNLKTLIKKKKELDSFGDLINDEKYAVGKQIKHFKREELKISKLFGNFDWQIMLKERLFDTITLDATDEKSPKEIQKRLNDFFGSWGGSECIYMFDDGREISCYYNADDADLYLSFDIREISSKEILEAFDELGIKVSFDRLQAHIDERKERLKKYEDLISEFKT